jgi:hypothetical protein
MKPHALSMGIVRWAAFLLVLLAAKAESAIRAHRSQFQLEPRDQCPGTYDFGLGTLHIVHHRSLKKDTVYIGATVIVNDTGTLTSYNISQYYGKHGDGKFQADIKFENVKVPDSAIAVMAYVIYNIGRGTQQDVKNQMLKLSYAIALKGTKAAADAPKEPTGEVVLDILGDIFNYKELGAAVTTIVDAVKAGKHGCDGWTGGGVHGFKGADICSKQATNANNLTGTDRHQGSSKTTLPGLVCSLKRSQYNMGWFVGSKPGLGNLTLLQTLNGVPPINGGSRGAWLWLALVVGGFLVFF